MTRRLSRRQALAGAVLGVPSIAGCTDPVENDPPPSIDADAEDLAAIADADGPEESAAFPLAVTDDYVATRTDYIESLLDSIPDDLGSEIPNQAVRRYVNDERDDARQRLGEMRAEPSNLAKLERSRAASRHGAIAEGAYAAASGDRSRSEAMAAAEELDDRLREAAAFDRIGDDPIPTLLVYDRVERRIGTANGSLETLESHGVPAALSDVEAVGEIDGYVERGRASLADGRHLIDRQAEQSDEERSFDDGFRTATAEFLDGVTDPVDDLPETIRDAGERLFDEPVADTPREYVGADIVRSVRGTRERVIDWQAEGRFANALLGLSRIETDLLALDRLRSPVADGGLDRPEDESDVKAMRDAAVAAIESARADPEYPLLLKRELESAIEGVRQGDRTGTSSGSNDPERAAVEMVAEYALAAERARTLPEATDRLVAVLP